MNYPACSNGSCTHNDRFRCKADGLEEDIICKIGKTEAKKKIKGKIKKVSLHEYAMSN